MSKLINIIGMGEVGQNVYDAIKDANFGESIIGTEVNPARIKELKEQGYAISKNICEFADIYIISAYLTEQVFSILEQLNKIQFTKIAKKPLVSIESTLHPTAVNDLKKYIDKFDLILFPHRYNPGDKAHHVWNLDRLMGGFKESSVNRGFEFFGRFMGKKLIHIFPVDIVNLSKPTENAYRFMEIAIAQQLKISCERLGINFEELKVAMNTKWNIDVKDALKGIGGKCLPKDMALISDYFDMNEFWDKMYYSNDKYKIWLKKLDKTD